MKKILLFLTLFLFLAGTGVVFGQTTVVKPTPVITKILPEGGIELKEGGRLVISVKDVEIKKEKVSVSIGGVNATVAEVYPGQIVVTLPKDARTGDVVVTVDGIKSVGYYIAIPRPLITFVFAKEGTFEPGDTIEVHGDLLLRSGYTTKVKVGDKEVVVKDRNFEKQIVEVELPNEYIKGDMVVETGGFLSNKVAVEAFYSPILKGAVRNPDGTFTLLGRFLADNSTKVMMGESTLTIISKTKDSIVASISDLTKGVVPGFIKVEENTHASNGVHFDLGKRPTVREITDLERQKKIIENGDIQYYYEMRVWMNNYVPKTKDTYLYMNGEALEIVQVYNEHIVARTKAVTQKGTTTVEGVKFAGKMYMVQDGIKGPEFTYDVLHLVQPKIASLSAPSGFGPARKIVIQGLNLGNESDPVEVISSIALTQDETTKKPMIIERTPAQITVQLAASAGRTGTGTIRVRVRGVESNLVTYPLNTEVKSVERDPEIRSVLFPEGHLEGQKVTIRGAGFSPALGKNTIYFPMDKKTFPIAGVGAEELTFILPPGIQSGKIYVETDGKKSNMVSIEVIPGKEQLVSFSFEQPKEILVQVKKEAVPTGTFVVRNFKNDLKVESIRFALDFTDGRASEDPFSFKNLEVIPIQSVTLSGPGIPSKTTSSVLRRGSEYTVLFQDLTFPASPTKQEYVLSVIFSEFAAPGSRTSLRFEPGNIEHFEAYFVDTNQRYTLKKDQFVTLTSVPVEIRVNNFHCIDGDKSGKYCNEYFNAMMLKDEKVEENATEPVTMTKPANPLQPQREEKEEVKSSGIERTELSLLPFRDIASVGWMHEELLLLYKKNAVQGVKNAEGQWEFHPEKAVSRAEMLKIALLALGMEEGSALPNPKFSDVPEGSWYYTYVAYAKAHGIVEGYGDGSFHPEAPMKRSEAIALLLKIQNITPAKATTSTFKDVEGWAVPWVNEGARRGYIGGYTDGTFRPYGELSRAEAVKILGNILETLQ